MEIGSCFENRNGGPWTKRRRIRGGADHLPNGGLDIHARDTLDEARCCCTSPCFKKSSSAIIWALESVFYKIGYSVALNPVKTILACLIVCGGMGVGLIKWREENNYVNLWLPRGSRMFDEYNWVEKYFPVAARYESVIIENTNVLTPESLNAMMDIYGKSTKFKTEDGYTLESLCVKSGPVCRVNSILDIWSYKETIIRNLSTAEILEKVNTDNLIRISFTNSVTIATQRSEFIKNRVNWLLGNQIEEYAYPLYQTEITVETILGGISRDENGTITRASAATMLWILEKNESLEDSAMDWELQLINFINDEEHEDLQNIYIYATRTFDDEAIGTVSKGTGLLTAGFSIVLVYVAVVMGNYSMIHHKILLAIGGLLSIGLSIVFTYGIGFITGLMYGVIHQILPFMILGIGVDDMFVIVESYKRLTPEQQELPVEERIALTLRHAGVSITVTSITDIVAFGIGASTVIPALSTFCIYATIGVFALYILQATYFVACLTLDQRRVDAKRNACILCYTHKIDYIQNKHYRFSVQNTFLKHIWGPLLTKRPIKIIVILIAIGMTVVNIWSFTKLEHDFDYKDYLPSDSYSLKYVEADRKYFPDDGTFVRVYCDKVNYYMNQDRFEELETGLSQMSTIQTSSVDFWLTGFTRWLNITLGLNSTRGLNADFTPNTKEAFYTLLQGFLFSLEGRGYLRYITVEDKMNISNIQASALTFRHTKFESSPEHIDAMDVVRSYLDNFTFRGGGTCFAYNGDQYMWNETNKVLKSELYRNLLIAVICVFLVTLLLIANLWTSVLVFICVVATVIDVAGTLQFWGVSIDTASSVLLILCFGLAVDYSAHVGHAFMTVPGTKNERAKLTLVVIGPAVFSGGFSTFLAFLLLANSTSYVYSLFFRTFTSVVGFGLFHGLTFLPVALSLIGPEPYDTSITESELEQYTNITYSTEDVTLNHRGNTPGVTINGYIRNDVLNSSNQLKINGCIRNDCPNSISRVKINGFIKNGVPNSSSRVKINGYIRNSVPNSSNQVKINGYIRNDESSSRVKINGYIKNGVPYSKSRVKINGYIRNSIPNSSNQVKINGYIRNDVPYSSSRVKIKGYIRNDIPNSSSRVNEGFDNIMELDSLPSPELSYGFCHEQLSDGTMVRIPIPDYTPILSHRKLSNGAVNPPPDYTL